MYNLKVHVLIPCICYIHLVWCASQCECPNGLVRQFSVPQREYPLGGSSEKGSHVYFLLQVFWVILLFDINSFQWDKLSCFVDYCIIEEQS